MYVYMCLVLSFFGWTFRPPLLCTSFAVLIFSGKIMGTAYIYIRIPVCTSYEYLMVVGKTSCMHLFCYFDAWYGFLIVNCIYQHYLIVKSWSLLFSFLAFVLILTTPLAFLYEIISSVLPNWLINLKAIILVFATWRQLV